MDLLLFGSPGAVVETGRLERLAFNAAFEELDLGIYWNVATYCKLAELPSGPEALIEMLGDEWTIGLAEEVHDCKLKHLEAYLADGIAPRDGVLETIALCQREGVRLGWVTDSPAAKVQLLLTATKGLEETAFDRIFTLEDIAARKPDPLGYTYALEQFGCSNDSVVAIEDSSVNQSSALSAGIQCYLYPGEYSSVDRNILLTRDLLEAIDTARCLWASDSTTQGSTASQPVGRLL